MYNNYFFMKQPLLIDMDGVLRLGNNPAPGVPEFLNT
jgi:ribonucleotide monophosphatase NagD (HAD superfamily)